MASAEIALSVLGSTGVQLAVFFGLSAWGRRVSRRQGTRGWRRAAGLPLAALGLFVVGAGVSTFYRALGGVSRVDAAQLLAEGTSTAMNCAAAFTLASWSLYAASVVGAVRRPAARAG